MSTPSQSKAPRVNIRVSAEMGLKMKALKKELGILTLSTLGDTLIATHPAMVSGDFKSFYKSYGEQIGIKATSKTSKTTEKTQTIPHRTLLEYLTSAFSNHNRVLPNDRAYWMTKSFVDVFKRMNVGDREGQRLWLGFVEYWTEGKGKNVKGIDWPARLANWVRNKDKFAMQKEDPNNLAGGMTSGNKPTIKLPEVKKAGDVK